MSSTQAQHFQPPPNMQNFQPPPSLPPAQKFQPPPGMMQQQQQQREPPPILDTPSQTCYVNHIQQKMKPNVLREKLQEAFSKFGTILEIHIRKSYKTRGQAWVTFDNTDSAKQAIEDLNQTHFLGNDPINQRPIQVNYSKNKAIIVAKKDGTYEERRKRRAVEGGGDSIPSVVGSADKNKRAKMSTFDKTIPPHSTLLIQQIPKEMSENDLVEMFNKFPSFKKIRFIRTRDVAFVDFNNVSSATHAINEVRRAERWMHLNYAKI
jgi:RNA recognition motif-containing protein